jgi:hypothetical protein
LHPHTPLLRHFGPWALPLQSLSAAHPQKLLTHLSPLVVRYVVQSTQLSVPHKPSDSVAHDPLLQQYPEPHDVPLPHALVHAPASQVGAPRPHGVPWVATRHPWDPMAHVTGVLPTQVVAVHSLMQHWADPAAP